KLEAVVLMAQPTEAGEIRQLAENLDQFEFIPDVQTLEDYGRYMIQESGHFEYDENLERFYNYRLYGEIRSREDGGEFTDLGYVSYHGPLTLEELMRDDPAEQYQREMGGLAQ
ncbi:MAG: antirestriction protein ArdA, partial [Oscillospiraceae bacterium]|nr:antirestriction protein ArdA [Oscillospiraceae bacterium]